RSGRPSAGSATATASSSAGRPAATWCWRGATGSPPADLPNGGTPTSPPRVPPNVRYADIARELATRGLARPSLTEVRETVLKVRRSKSMVLDPGDPNARSCGSFFLNPIVTADALALIDARAVGLSMPRWPQPDGHVKLSAAWLIE